MTISAYRLEYYSTNGSYNGKKAINFLVSAMTNDYPLLDNLKISRGKLKGLLKFTLSEFDYTSEDVRRKVRWKLQNNKKQNGKAVIGHITKLASVTSKRFVGDVKGTKDKVLLISNDDMTILYLFIIPEAKSDYTMVDEFGDGDLDVDLNKAIKRMQPVGVPLQG